MKTKTLNIKKFQLSIFLILFLSLTFNNNINSQSKMDTIIINTSAQCSMCKERIEKNLAYEKGVKSSGLDLKTKAVTVVYDTRKTDAEKIRKAISDIGYDADNVPADQAAYDKLPACCKKPDDPNAAPHSH